jgi:hypothetical protein
MLMKSGSWAMTVLGNISGEAPDPLMAGAVMLADVADDDDDAFGALRIRLLTFCHERPPSAPEKKKQRNRKEQERKNERKKKEREREKEKYMRSKFFSIGLIDF